MVLKGMQRPRGYAGMTWLSVKKKHPGVPASRYTSTSVYQNPMCTSTWVYQHQGTSSAGTLQLGYIMKHPFVQTAYAIGLIVVHGEFNDAVEFVNDIHVDMTAYVSHSFCCQTWMMNSSQELK